MRWLVQREAPMLTSKRNILYFRCSDGRSRRPENILEHCVHQIRLPGGILFPELCESEARRRLVGTMVRRVVMFAIDVMIKLKSPDEIILASHSDCGAAIALGFEHETVKARHVTLGNRLRKRFPHITITVLHEEHTESGESREWEMPLQMAAQES